MLILIFIITKFIKKQYIIQTLIAACCSCTLAVFDDCLNGLGKCHPFVFAALLSAARELNATLTDLDLFIINMKSLLFLLSSSFGLFSTSSTTLLLFLNIDSNDVVLPLLLPPLPAAGAFLLAVTVVAAVGNGGFSAVNSRFGAYFERDRRNGIASDLDFRMVGSVSPEATPEKNEKVEDDDVDADVAAGQHSQGRVLAQLGHKVLRRSRKQVGQIPVRRRFEGCVGHLKISSSSI